MRKIISDAHLSEYKNTASTCIGGCKGCNRWDVSQFEKYFAVSNKHGQILAGVIP